MNKGHVFQDKSGKWRWRVVNVENGDITASSGQHFYSESNATRAGKSEFPSLEWVVDPPEEVV